jgi:hypothetical protein
LARDRDLLPYTVSARRRVAGTNVEWDQPCKILPIDPTVRAVILQIERDFEAMLASLEGRGAHLPSRVRSLIWILCSLPVMGEHGIRIADDAEVLAELQARLPQTRRAPARPAVAIA